MSVDDYAYVGEMGEYYNSQVEFKRETKLLSVLNDSEFLLYILIRTDPRLPYDYIAYDMALKAKESNSLTLAQRHEIESAFLRSEFGWETDRLGRDCDEKN